MTRNYNIIEWEYIYTLREAARKYNVPESTLRYYINKNKNILVENVDYIKRQNATLVDIRSIEMLLKSMQKGEYENE